MDVLIHIASYRGAACGGQYGVKVALRQLNIRKRPARLSVAYQFKKFHIRTLSLFIIYALGRTRRLSHSLPYMYEHVQI
jgi:hypothetical protein